MNGRGRGARGGGSLLEPGRELLVAQLAPEEADEGLVGHFVLELDHKAQTTHLIEQTEEIAKRVLEKGTDSAAQAVLRPDLVELSREDAEFTHLLPQSIAPT
jgi:hypothetical protein